MSNVTKPMRVPAITKQQGKTSKLEVKSLLRADPDLVREIVRAALQEVLEVEMMETIGAAKGERSPGRLGYRAGYYGRTLITCVGKLELRGRERRSRPGSRGPAFHRAGRALPAGAAGAGSIAGDTGARRPWRAFRAGFGRRSG